MNKTQNKAKWTPEMGRDLAAFHNVEWWVDEDDLTSDCLDEDPIMNETQYRIGDLVKLKPIYDEDRGIVVKVVEAVKEPWLGVKVYWFRKGVIWEHSGPCLQLLSRGHNNDNE